MSFCERFQSSETALCVGLDPVPDRLPPGVSFRDFCLAVIEATADLAACFKPNVAFYERLGPEGLEILREVLAAVRERSLPVIADAKRGDVGPTAQAYADAFFGGPFDCDALTVNPSLGLDAVEPFRRAAIQRDRGVILLLRTSNPGAAQFQDGWEAGLLEAIGAERHYGAVVGATDAEAGARLRAALPETFFLVPGFGAQGGSDLGAFFDSSGGGAVVNSSRAILYAGEGRSNWKGAVRDAARAARDAIQEARRR